MPSSSPSALRSAAPLWSARAGTVKSAPSMWYSHQPENGRRDTMRARLAPPMPATSSGSPASGLRRPPERHRVDAQRRERAHHAEAGGRVVADHAGGNDAAARQQQVDLVGLDQQVADGEHQAVAVDDDARALAHAAERGVRARVAQRQRAQADHRAVGALQRRGAALDGGRAGAAVGLPGRRRRRAERRQREQRGQGERPRARAASASGRGRRRGEGRGAARPRSLPCCMACSRLADGCRA